jgi:hypothetical protein
VAVEGIIHSVMASLDAYNCFENCLIPEAYSKSSMNVHHALKCCYENKYLEMQGSSPHDSGGSTDQSSQFGHLKQLHSYHSSSTMQLRPMQSAVRIIVLVPHREEWR